MKDISAAPLIKIASVVILLQALDLASLEFFRAFGRMKKYSGLMLLQTFAEVGFVAYFVLAGFGLFGAVISLLISRGIVLFTGAFFLYLRKLGLDCRNSMDWKIISSLGFRWFQLQCWAGSQVQATVI